MERKVINLKEYKDNNKWRVRKDHIPLTAKEELEIWERDRHHYYDQDFIDNRIKELKEKIKCQKIKNTNIITFLYY
jgi:hypothetical protein